MVSGAYKHAGLTRQCASVLHMISDLYVPGAQELRQALAAIGIIRAIRTGAAHQEHVSLNWTMGK